MNAEQQGRRHPCFRAILSAGTRPLKHAGLGLVANEPRRAETRDQLARLHSLTPWAWRYRAPAPDQQYPFKDMSTPLTLVLENRHRLPST
jgi:hypothetical protein